MNDLSKKEKLSLAERDRKEIEDLQKRYGCKINPLVYDVRIHQDVVSFVAIEASSAVEAKQIAREMLNSLCGIPVGDVVFEKDAHISDVILDTWEEVKE